MSDPDQIESDIHIGIVMENDWNGPSIKEGQLTGEEVRWLAIWLAGCGYTKEAK